MEAPEVPTEHLHEELHHHAEHAGEGERWTLGVALSSAIIAGFAAVASLLAGVNANEAMVDQMRASDQWNYYQAKGVKSNVLSTKIELLSALGKAPEAKDVAKVKTYKKEQEEISKLANEKTKSSEDHLETHEMLARSVTMFQVAIAIAAVSVLAKRRKFWYVALISSVVGIGFLGQGLISMKKLQAEEVAEAQEAKESAEPTGATAEKPHVPGHGGEAAGKPAGEAAPAGESAPAAPEK